MCFLLKQEGYISQNSHCTEKQSVHAINPTMAYKLQLVVVQHIALDLYCKAENVLLVHITFLVVAGESLKLEF